MKGKAQLSCIGAGGLMKGLKPTLERKESGDEALL